MSCSWKKKHKPRKQNWNDYNSIVKIFAKRIVGDPDLIIHLKCRTASLSDSNFSV